MPIVYGPTSVLLTIEWTSVNFATGGGTTNFAFNATGSPTPGGELLAERLAAVCVTDVLPEVDSNYRIEAIRWETDVLSGEVEVGSPGLRSGVSPPPQVAALCALKAGQKGRRNSGRQFWPGVIAQNQVGEDGLLTIARVQELQDMVDAVATFVEATDDVVQSISQTEFPGQQSPPNIPWPIVQSRTVQARVATQRRRVRR